MSIRKLKNIKERLDFISKATGKKLEAIGIYPSGLEQAQFKNCENMIGATTIPLGIAGPLFIKGEYARGNFYIPLATTEGVLVASVNRGCKSLSLSGGVNVRVENAGITRGAVFKTKSIQDSLTLKKWIIIHQNDLAKVTEQTSSHLKFLDLFITVTGRNVYVRFSYDSSDAMGMNMVTIATESAVKYVEKETGYRCLSLAGNFDLDKKPSWLNFILGRGKRVWAEATLKNEAVAEVLKTTSSKIHEVAKEKNLIGSIISGSLGFNGHFANIIAGMFLATGQDPAHIVEGSLGIVTTDLDKDGLYISAYLPDLIIGTVGGGTALPAQKEALDILGISGGNNGRNALKLAEIVGGAVLAGEISLLASLSEGSLSRAHLSLARNK